MFKIAIPVIHVSDSATAKEFYCQRLEFNLLFSYQPDETNNDLLATPIEIRFCLDSGQTKLQSDLRKCEFASRKSHNR